MEQYIPKSAVVVEIKNLIERAEAERVLHPKTILAAKNYLLIEDYKKLLSFIDSLEVKEVDLEKELIEWHKEHFKKDGTFIRMSGFYLTNSSQMDIAKHFFELGTKAQHSELTWEDISVLRKIMAEYRRQTSNEMLVLNDEDYCKEVLNRFKAQK